MLCYVNMRLFYDCAGIRYEECKVAGETEARHAAECHYDSSTVKSKLHTQGLLLSFIKSSGISEPGVFFSAHNHEQAGL